MSVENNNRGPSFPDCYAVLKSGPAKRSYPSTTSNLT